MKKIIFLLALPVVCCSFLFFNAKEITPAERKFAADHLNKTRAELIASVKGLSQKQLNYKVDSSHWSILECVQHIALSSPGIFGMAKQTAEGAADTSLKSSFPDEQFIMMVEDRSHKAQAAEPFKPIHAPYKTLDETLKAFNTGRDSAIAYINTTNDDLRGHVNKLPFGNADAYQLVLLVSAHTNRHMQQINEVKASPGFPKQ